MSHGSGQDFGRAFAMGVSLNVIYVVLEAIFGLYSGSLALLADAGHNLSDVVGLLLAWGAIWLSKKPPQGRQTFGFKRSSVLASLGNAILLLIAVGAIAWEAVRRLLEPEQVASSTVIWVALVGVAVNGLTAYLFSSGRKGDLNIRGAFLHMAADTGVTVGVIIAAMVIRWTGWLWVDPVISLMIAIVILVGTWPLLRDSTMLAMDAVPSGVDLAAIQKELMATDGVVEVHDLHVWALSTTETALTAHLVCPEPEEGQNLLRTLPAQLQLNFGIDHATFQVETPATARQCPLRPGVSTSGKALFQFSDTGA
jgi:cobalt-zinc-cadmium efflux system protein